MRNAPAVVIPQPRPESRICRACRRLYPAWLFPERPGLCETCPDTSDAGLHRRSI